MIMLIIPWIFILYLVGNIFSGDIGWLLGFVLVVILVPLAVVVNLMTAFLVRGKQFADQFKQARQQAQSKASGQAPKSKTTKSGRVKVKNYANDKTDKS
jgi:type III secretory pathway component EscV